MKKVINKYFIDYFIIGKMQNFREMLSGASAFIPDKKAPSCYGNIQESNDELDRDNHQGKQHYNIIITEKKLFLQNEL